jgi:light-regulated signal transduction histidine kinase (bacteriophytochrome)
MENQAQGVAPNSPARDCESVHDFISMAVHDMREPLRGIRLGSQLLVAGRDPADENAARGTRFLLDSVDRLETLIHDIAEYCYAEVREPDSKETDLEMVLLEAKNEISAQLKSAGATITHDPLPTVMGNAPALTTVLRSLIGNACKFRSEAAPSIHVGVRQQGAQWIFSVRDNGMGFDPAYRERIFRAFERLNGKKYPGSGLGLTIAKRLINHHGGEIWAESNPGQGATFSFSLPLAV